MAHTFPPKAYQPVTKAELIAMGERAWKLNPAYPSMRREKKATKKFFARMPAAGAFERRMYQLIREELEYREQIELCS